MEVSMEWLKTTVGGASETMLSDFNGADEDKKIPLGSRSAFWHVPILAGTLMGFCYDSSSCSDRSLFLMQAPRMQTRRSPSSTW